MAIPQVVPGSVVTFVQTCVASLTWHHAAATVSSMEAAFYRSLRGGAIETPTFTTKSIAWLRDAAFHHLNKIQILFNCASVGMVAFSAAEILTHAALSKSQIGLLSAAVAGTVFLGYRVINRVAIPLAPGKGDRATRTEITEEYSIQQKISKTLQIARIVVGAAGAYFMKNRFLLVVSLSTAVYSLWKNIHLKWIAFTKERRWESGWGRGGWLKNFKVTYRVPVLALNQPRAEADACPICLNESDAQEEILFCTTDSLLHKTCMERIVLLKIDHLGTYVDATKRIYQNIFDLLVYGVYQVTMRVTQFPGCPCCKVIPRHNRFSMRINHGSTDLQIADQEHVERAYDRGSYREELFSKLYAAYNVAQAGLAFLQTYPHLAAGIYKIQKLMVATDLLGYGLTVFYLFKTIHAKYAPSGSKAPAAIGVVVAAALIAALSWYLMAQLNLYLKPVIVLADVLKGLGLSPELLATIRADFNSPMMHKLMQWLFINRIAASTALAMISDTWKKTQMVGLAAQAASFAGISSLKWIEIGQSFDHIVDGVASAQTTHHFLIGSSCLSHIQSTMKAITDYTTKFFNDSEWYSYWLNYYHNAALIRRELVYEITLAKKAIEACGCSLVPALTDTAVKVIETSGRMADTVNLL